MILLNTDKSRYCGRWGARRPVDVGIAPTETHFMWVETIRRASLMLIPQHSPDKEAAASSSTRKKNRTPSCRHGSAIFYASKKPGFLPGSLSAEDGT